MALTGKEKVYVSEGSGRASVMVDEIADYTATQDGASWSTLAGKPVVIAAGDDQASARGVIGAGTSNLVIGTDANTAKAGNWQPGANDMAVSQTVKNILGAADTNGVQSQMGATSTGKLLITAATPADALSAIGAIDKTVPPGTASRGGVLQQPAIANLTAAPTMADFNGLLAALRSAGMLAA